MNDPATAWPPPIARDRYVPNLIAVDPTRGFCAVYVDGDPHWRWPARPSRRYRRLLARANAQFEISKEES